MPRMEILRYFTRNSTISLLLIAPKAHFVLYLVQGRAPGKSRIRLVGPGFASCFPPVLRSSLRPNKKIGYHTNVFILKIRWRKHMNCQQSLYKSYDKSFYLDENRARKKGRTPQKMTQNRKILKNIFCQIFEKIFFRVFGVFGRF